MALQFPPITCSASGTGSVTGLPPAATPTPWAWSTDCAGYGALTPANVTTASGATVTLLLCQCDAWYTGGMDMFDTRAAYVDGAWLSLSCQQSVVGVLVMWSLLLVLLSVRVYGVSHALVHRCRRRGLDKVELLYDDLAYSCLALDLFVLCPLFAATCVLKIVGEVVGTDAAVTTVFVSVPVVYQVEHVRIATAEFAALVSTLNVSGRKRLVRAHRVVSVMGVASYVTLTVVPTLAALGVTRAPNASLQGPLCNYEIVLLILRNVG